MPAPINFWNIATRRFDVDNKPGGTIRKLLGRGVSPATLRSHRKLTMKCKTPGAVLLIALLSVAMPLPTSAQTGPFEGSTAPNLVGYPIALDRNTVAVGACVFERDKNHPDRWSEVACLTNGVSGSDFGHSIALDGDRLIVGAPNETTDRGTGAVYIYYRNRGGKNKWGLVRRVRAAAQLFGWSVSISGNTALASALDDEDTGEVHVLERDRGGPDRWHGVQLTPSEGFYDPGCKYCWPYQEAQQVAISGDTLAVETDSGALIFDRDPNDPSGWREIRKLDGLSTFALDGSTLVGVNKRQVVLHERNQRGTNRWGRWGSFKTSDHFVAGARREGPLAIRGNTMVAAWRFDAADGSVKRATLVFDRHAGGRNRWGSVARLVGDNLTDVWSERISALAVGPREVVTSKCGEYRYLNFEICETWVEHRLPILADDFESADLSAWSQKKRKVAVVRPGLGGSEHALEVTLDGKAKKSFVRSKHPVEERSFSLSFLFLANYVDLGDRTVEILRLAGGRKNVKLTLEEEGGEYLLGLWAGHNKGALELIGRTRVPARRGVKLGIEWQRATGPGHNNGIVRLFKKNRVVAEATDMDTDQLKISDVRLGLPSGSKGTGGGSYFVDLYESNR